MAPPSPPASAGPAASALATRFRHGLGQAVLSALAAVLAWLPTQPLGLREGFWAAITAIAVSQTEWNAAASTGRDQLAGAAIGGLTAGAVAWLGVPPLAGFVLALPVAITLCAVVGVAGAARLAGITTVIVFLVPHQGSVAMMIASRVGEVAWGAVIAIVLVWLATRLGHHPTRPA